MEQLTRKEALDEGYELCIADWMDVGDNGYKEAQLIEDMEEEELKAGDVYILEKEPYEFVDGEPIYSRTEFILIP